MTLFTSIILILSSNVLIFNIPESHGKNQGYHQSTLSQVLTPSERFTYLFTGVLPNRIYYSHKKRCYVVRGQPGYYRNDLRRKKGKKYKVVPRWQYYMDKLSPMDLIKYGGEFLSVGKALLSGGDFAGDNEDNDVEIDDANDNANDGEDDDANGGADDDENGGADDDENGGAADSNDNNKEPGLLSKGLNMSKGMVSPLLNLFGGSKDTDNINNNENNKGNNNKKDDDNNDEKKDNDKEGDKPVESTDYGGMAKDLLGSDVGGIAKDVIEGDTAGFVQDVLKSDTAKTLIASLVPGGPFVVTAMNAASKYNSANKVVDNVEDKIPKLK